MTELCDAPPDCQEGKPVSTGNSGPRRWLWAFLSIGRLKAAQGKPRLGRLHRLNDHLLRDIGLSLREGDHEVPHRFAARQDIDTE
jgi:hypothetical protein